MYRSCTRRASTTFANMNGNVHTPPSAIKLPATKGDAPNARAENIGMFVSHAPRTKKHVMANQHIVAMTAHCWNETFAGASKSSKGSAVVGVGGVDSTVAERRSEEGTTTSSGEGGEEEERRGDDGGGDSRLSDTAVRESRIESSQRRGTSSNKIATINQKRSQTAAMTHPGLVYPLKTAFANPTLYSRPPTNGPTVKPVLWPTTSQPAKVVRRRTPTMRGSEQYRLAYKSCAKETPITTRPARMR